MVLEMSDDPTHQELGHWYFLVSIGRPECEAPTPGSLAEFYCQTKTPTVSLVCYLLGVKVSSFGRASWCYYVRNETLSPAGPRASHHFLFVFSPARRARDWLPWYLPSKTG